MAKPYRGRRSENDVLIEMRRLRGELAHVRDRMGRERSSSFRHDRPTAGQLRNRAGLAMLVALGLVAATLCWLLYRLLASTVGTLFDDLLPQPLRIGARVVIEVAALFF